MSEKEIRSVGVIQQGPDPLVTQAAPFHEAPCGCVRAHTPRPATIEKHHTWPQFDQRQKYGKLVEPETVALCPSSHRSVHFSIDLNLKGEPHQLGNTYLRGFVEYALARIREG